jgi:uncharacterized protein (TIGR03435 family)
MRTLLLLTLAAAAAGQTFDVASIRPAAPPIGRPRGNRVLGDRVDFQAATLKYAILFAYNVKDYQVVGPAWLTDSYWEIVAKASGPATREELAVMMRSLLAERFHLQAHTETRDYAGLVLIVGKSGPKLKPAAPAAAEPVSPTLTFHFGGGGNVRSPRLSMGALADRITAILGRPVSDDTGLLGDYQVSLEYAPGESISQTRGSLVPPPPNPNPGVSIFTSIQELGLKLEPRKLQLPTIVIDKIEKTPTEN